MSPETVVLWAAAGAMLLVLLFAVVILGCIAGDIVRDTVRRR